MPQDWQDPKRKVRELEAELLRLHARAQRLGETETAALIAEAARRCSGAASTEPLRSAGLS